MLTPDWNKKLKAEKRRLKALRRKQSRKMSKSSRIKHNNAITSCEANIERYAAYASGAAIPKPKEIDMKTPLRIIELPYGDTPWRVSINIDAIETVNFLPKQDENKNMESFDVYVIMTSGQVHTFPFNHAFNAQEFYEYIKSTMASFDDVSVAGIRVFDIPEPQQPVSNEPESEPGEPEPESPETD